MERPNYGITKRRAFALALLIVFIFGGYTVRLFQIQIVEGEAYSAISSSNTAVTVPIAASRGEILDTNLRSLVVNQTSFSIVFDYAYFPRGSDSADAQQQENDIILSLTELLTKQGCDWNDTLPISTAEPFTFLENRDNSIAYLKSSTMLRMGDYATAEQCMTALAERYGLSGYTREQQRIIAGVRYEIEIRAFSLKSPFTFSSDISEDTYTIILENSSKYPGVNVQTTAVRDYVAGSVACHLLGSVGPIYAEEYASLKDQGYELNDTVGKSGIESAMESSLRGTNGVSTIIKDSSGNALEKEVTTEPVAGDTVVLTLDSELQAAAQDALNTTITELRSQNTTLKGEDVKSGSVVVLDVKTGGVLACASWPSYDLSTYNQNYSNLIADADKPLFNRALYGAFPCGSTMKPCVALTGLNEGYITPTDTPVYCSGRYEYFASSGFTPKCMGTHGSLNVISALAKSCNVFFYDLGRRLDIETMNSYATAFGLGQKTGIEIGESAGVLAGPEEREAAGGIWSWGDNCNYAIGQSDNMFTPIQLAAYAMGLANNGVRYKTHLVKSVISADGTETLVETEVAASIELSTTATDTVREGMIQVAKSGTAKTEFGDFPYSIACKTGTAQVGDGLTHSDHGVFIGYTSAENPEIAIAVVLENGTSHPAARVARQVLNAYYALKDSGTSPTPEGELLQ